jgi:hypothetical protein
VLKAAASKSVSKRVSKGKFPFRKFIDKNWLCIFHSYCS